MQGQQGSDVCQTLRDWFDRIPPMSLLVMYTLLGCFLLTYFTDLGVFLINAPEDTLLKLQLWRLLTASFVVSSIFSLLISLFMYMPTACDSERRMGTVKYQLYLLMNCVIIQAVCAGLILGGAASIGFAPWTMGLWGVIMLEIVVRCNRDPEAVVGLWCCPATIKSKYYPWVLLLLFLLLGGVQLDLLIGTALGYVCKVYADVFGHAECMQLSDTKANRLQECVPFRWLKGMRNFVSVENSGLPFTVVERVQSNSNSSSPAPAQPQFVPFSGRGYTTSDPPPRPQPSGYMPQRDEEDL